jgi:putative salt-induced outer membrane protein YdiY
MQRVIIICLFAFPLFAQTPAKPWASNFGAGLAVTSGNTSTKNVNVSFNTKYDPKTRLLFKAEALYLLGKSNGEKQVDKATADAREEYTLSDRTFTFGEISYLRDPFKGIDYSLAPLAGVGYRIFKTDRRTLSVDGAAGAIVENESGIGRTTSGALKAGENFEWSLSPVSKVTEKVTGIWKTDDFADALYHFDAGITTTINTRAELKVAYNYDYKNQTPSPAIKKGDSAFFAAVLFKF